MRTKGQFNQFLANVMVARQKASREDLNFDSRNYILLVGSDMWNDLRANATPDCSGWVVVMPNANSGYTIEVIGFRAMRVLREDIGANNDFMLVKQVFSQ